MWTDSKIVYKNKIDRLKIIKKYDCCCVVIKGLRNKLNYFGDESNLHGVGHVLSVNKIPWFKRLFWLIVIGCSAYGAAALFKASLNLFKANAISYTVETAYLEWETPFPAVTFCEDMNVTRINSYLNEHNMPLTMAPFYKEINFWSSKFCNICSNCKINETCAENFTEITRNFRLKCNEILTDCWWNDEMFPCCDRFHPLETEYGICYTFNSKLTGNGSNVLQLSRITGLRNFVFTIVRAASMRIHSPDETISVASENLLNRQSHLALIQDVDVLLKVEQTTSTLSVRSLPPKARGCLLWWERPEFVRSWNLKHYSYSACMLQCRAEAQADRCNCTHHFMPRIDGVQICDIIGLVCLSKSKDVNNVECECPMACEETLYKLVNFVSDRIEDDKLTPELVARGTKGSVRLAELPTVRVRRHAIRDNLSLVVDVGGVGGVFFGASVLSVIEIIYLFCIRRNT